jgi:hypothetical protein
MEEKGLPVNARSRNRRKMIVLLRILIDCGTDFSAIKFLKSFNFLSSYSIVILLIYEWLSDGLLYSSIALSPAS